MHVRHVEYIENGYKRLIGTLYMTTFRLVFAPDNENEDNNVVYNYLKKIIKTSNIHLFVLDILRK